jgi:hypothetical protein
MAATGLVDAQGTLFASTYPIEGSGPPPEYRDISVPAFGVLRSADGGATWQPNSNGLPFSRIYSVAASATGLVFAAADWRIYRSSDRGSNWNSMGSPTSFYGFQLLFPPAADVVYAWFLSSLFVAPADGNGSWVRNNMPTTPSVLTITPQNTVLFVDYTGQSVARSVNHGSTWTTQNNVFPSSYLQFIASGRYTRVAFSIAPGTTYLSNDDGLTWTPIGSLYGPMAFSPDETTLYVTSGGQVKALQEAGNWTPVSTPAVPYAYTLAVDPAGAVYAATSSGIYRWKPGDVVWQSLGPTAPGAFAGRAGWKPQVVAARDGFVYAPTWNAALWRLESGAPSDAQDGIDMVGTPMVFPNPLRSHTTIGFRLGQSATASLTLFDVRGRRVARLLDGAKLPAGPHQVDWLPPASMARGVYVYELRLGSTRHSGRLVLR